jgi:hypothetical protein
MRHHTLVSSRANDAMEEVLTEVSEESTSLMRMERKRWRTRKYLEKVPATNVGLGTTLDYYPSSLLTLEKKWGRQRHVYHNFVHGRDMEIRTNTNPNLKVVCTSMINRLEVATATATATISLWREPSTAPRAPFCYHPPNHPRSESTNADARRQTDGHP